MKTLQVTDDAFINVSEVLSFRLGKANSKGVADLTVRYTHGTKETYKIDRSKMEAFIRWQNELGETRSNVTVDKPLKKIKKITIKPTPELQSLVEASEKGSFKEQTV